MELASAFQQQAFRVLQGAGMSNLSIVGFELGLFGSGSEVRSGNPLSNLPLTPTAAAKCPTPGSAYVRPRLPCTSRLREPLGFLQLTAPVLLCALYS